MMRRSSRIAGITDIADDITGNNPVADFERAKISQMRIVMRLPPRSDSPDHIPAQPVLPHSDDNTFSRRPNRGSGFGKNIDALMMTTTASRSSPSITDRRWPYAVHRNRQARRRFGNGQL